MTYRGAQNLIKRGDEPGLRAALEAGLDPNLANQNGWTLLMLAAVEGHVGIGRLLIEKGCDLNACNNKQDSALALASHRGHQLFADLLTGNGVSGS
ncbi:MAG: ankyrin repeat domain-containing protein [Acidobacteriaceae bacterium]